MGSGFPRWRGRIHSGGRSSANKIRMESPKVAKKQILLGWVAHVRVGVILLLKFEVSRFRRGVFGLRCGASSICSQVEPGENARYTPDKIEIEIRSHLASHRQLPFSVRTALTVINCPRLQSLTFNVNKQMTPDIVFLFI